MLGSCEAAFDRSDYSNPSVAPETIPTYEAEFGLVASETEQPDDQRKSWLFKSNNPFLKARNVISLQKVFAVEAGSSTFYLVAEKVAGEAEFSASDKTLTLVFIPKAYGAISSSSATAAPTTTVSNTVGNGQAAPQSLRSNSVSSTEAEIAKLKAEMDDLRSLLQQVAADKNKQ